jgi:predicted nucleic acid-binding protein
MAAGELLCDTGPLVAFLNRSDQYHSWAKRQFCQITQPLFTCEAVVSEVVFLLQDDGLSADPLFEAIDRGKIKAAFAADTHWPDLRRLIRKYQDLPMSFADACLVRMSELAESCHVFTTDSDFRVYRRHGRQVIPLLSPFD